MNPLKVDLLTDDMRIAQICKDYWSHDDLGKFDFKVAQVAQKYGLKSNDVSKIVYNGCDAYSNEIICCHCQGAIVLIDRSNLQQILRVAERLRICSDCKIKEAENLEKKRQEQLKVCRLLIEEHYALQPISEPDLYSFTLEDSIYLLSFIRATSSEDLSIYGPVASSAFPLAPTTEYAEKIVDHLHQKKLIHVDPNSPLESFEFENGLPKHTSKVRWTLMTGKNIDETRRFVMRLENTLKTPELRPFVWNEQILQFWRKLALHECLEYLEVVLNEHGFVLKAGDKTILALKALLENYSVAQAYNFIWRAGRDAAAFHQRALVTDRYANKQHAANTVVGSMQRQSERAQVEGWDTKPFGRNFSCPESMVSQVFFNVVLQIGSAGFSQVPRVLPKRDDPPNANVI